MLRCVFVVVCCSFALNHGVFSEESKDKFDHFKEFSLNLLFQSDMDEFSLEKGAAISSPFGVGYMLANANEKVWNISTSGIDTVLKTAGPKVTEEYVGLLDNLKQGNVSTSSTLFSKELNETSPFPQGSLKMKTELKYTNYIGDWKGAWYSINDKISEQTNGKLNDQLVPKGGWWGGAFYHFTMGAMINTVHYKSEWENKWTNGELKNFSDGLPVQFYQTEGEFPYVDNANFTAISFDLKGGNKSIVFVLPKYELSSFLQNDLASLFGKTMSYPQNWGKKNIKTEVPALNITLLDQHYKKLELLGINYTFCVDETNSIDVMKNKGAYFMSPIVQSHHFEFSPDYFEVATATGASINSEEKLKQEPADYELNSAEDSTATDSSEEDATTYSPEQMSAEALGLNEDSTNKPPVVGNEVAPAASEVPVPIAVPIATSPVDPPSALIKRSADSNSLVFDRPFFWYLSDKEMGPVFFGSIQSLATYKKEYGLENDEDLWLFDAYKTLLWNCP